MVAAARPAASLSRCKTHEIIQRGEQRAKMVLIIAPPPLRITVNRATYLGGASCTHGAASLLEGEATRIPTQFAMLNKSA
jgi:hypothetical protein